MQIADGVGFRLSKNIRDDVLEIFLAALDQVNGRHVVSQHLKSSQYEHAAPAVVAIGKAAQAMMLGAYDLLGEAISDQGMVITKAGHLEGSTVEEMGVLGLESGHPLPNEQSLDAGSMLLDFLSQQPAGRPLLFLLSGGTSSLVEVLQDGVTLSELSRANSWLLASGLPIKSINDVRRRLSKIKGGGLLQFIGQRPVDVLLISDVQGDDPAVIGSGLLVASDSTPTELNGLALPDWLQALIERCDVLRPVSQTDISLQVVANLDMACGAAVKKAEELGYAVVRHNEFLCGDAEVAGKKIAKVLKDGAVGIHIWGGETTVCLPLNSGCGGRNQHLALTVAQEIAGCDGLYLLAVGTDGSDGTTSDAGALVDGGTIARAAIEGYDSADCLRRADAGSLLAASGDLINTGPTGTNVMDLVIALKPQ